MKPLTAVCNCNLRTGSSGVLVNQLPRKKERQKITVVISSHLHGINTPTVVSVKLPKVSHLAHKIPEYLVTDFYKTVPAQRCLVLFLFLWVKQRWHENVSWCGILFWPGINLLCDSRLAISSRSSFRLFNCKIWWLNWWFPRSIMAVAVKGTKRSPHQSQWLSTVQAANISTIRKM